MKFTEDPILVIGDLILDEYISGTASRLSPEAPVPVVRIAGNADYRLGGAGNVAANIRALGGNPIPIGVIGTDDNAERVRKLLRASGISTAGLLSNDLYGKTTTVKTRVIANGQQVARIDCEEPFNEDQILPTIQTRIAAQLQGAAAVVISDYNKGTITKDVLDFIMKHTGDRLVFLDPKVREFNIYKFVNGLVTCITPNVHEAERLSGIKIHTNADIELAAENLWRRFGVDYVLITRGEAGMSLFSRTTCIYGQDIPNKPYTVHHIPTTAQSVFDVSGAGDTVIATLALARMSAMPMLDAAKLANIAAGIVVGKPGTAVISLDELNAAVQIYRGGIL